MEKDNKGKAEEDHEVDFTRYIIGINQILMYLYILLYFFIYIRPRDFKRLIRTATVLFTVLHPVILIKMLINFILYGVSHCVDKHYGYGAIISTVFLLVVSILVMLLTVVIFCKSLKKQAVTHGDEPTERDSLVKSTPEKPPAPKPEPPKPAEEEEYRPGGDDDMDGGGDDDGIE